MDWKLHNPLIARHASAETPAKQGAESLLRVTFHRSGDPIPQRSRFSCSGVEPAILSALYAPQLIKRLGSRLSIAISMGVLASFMTLSPYSRVLPVAVFLYSLMGSARGVSGVAMNTSLMEQVPQHFMGRVQNAFYFVGTFLQIALGLTVGSVAQKVSLAGGFAIIGSVYLVAFVSAVWPVGAATRITSDVAP